MFSLRVQRWYLGPALCGQVQQSTCQCSLVTRVIPSGVQMIMGFQEMDLIGSYKWNSLTPLFVPRLSLVYSLFHYDKDLALSLHFESNVLFPGHVINHIYLHPFIYISPNFWLFYSKPTQAHSLTSSFLHCFFFTVHKTT